MLIPRGRSLNHVTQWWWSQITKVWNAKRESLNDRYLRYFWPEASAKHLRGSRNFIIWYLYFQLSQQDIMSSLKVYREKLAVQPRWISLEFQPPALRGKRREQGDRGWTSSLGTWDMNKMEMKLPPVPSEKRPSYRSFERNASRWDRSISSSWSSIRAQFGVAQLWEVITKNRVKMNSEKEYSFISLNLVKFVKQCYLCFNHVTCMNIRF